jgi:hypothetical protein
MKDLILLDECRIDVSVRSSSEAGYRADLNTYAAPVARRSNSLSLKVISAKPQSRQSKSFEHTKTAGLSRFFSPGKWTLVSALNSAWLSGPHVLQGIPYPELDCGAVCVGWQPQ